MTDASTDLKARIAASELPESLEFYHYGSGTFTPFGGGRTRADWDKIAATNEARTAHLIDD